MGQPANPGVAFALAFSLGHIDDMPLLSDQDPLGKAKTIRVNMRIGPMANLVQSIQLNVRARRAAGDRRDE
jgi:hypothetical protein